jgi:hypothetical protein
MRQHRLGALEYDSEFENELSIELDSYLADSFADTPEFFMGLIQACDEYISAVVDYSVFHADSTSG